MAEYAHKFVTLGARVVGGCCGSTPAHIQAIAQAMAAIAQAMTVAAQR
jgi:methionine synthase I (cobalamin-dependent)